jgi:hypothetical protein
MIVAALPVANMSKESESKNGKREKKKAVNSIEKLVTFLFRKIRDQLQ